MSIAAFIAGAIAAALVVSVVLVLHSMRTRRPNPYEEASRDKSPIVIVKSHDGLVRLSATVHQLRLVSEFYGASVCMICGAEVCVSQVARVIADGVVMHESCCRLFRVTIGDDIIPEKMPDDEWEGRCTDCAGPLGDGDRVIAHRGMIKHYECPESAVRP